LEKNFLTAPPEKIQHFQWIHGIQIAAAYNPTQASAKKLLPICAGCSTMWGNQIISRPETPDV
jgi:hypothetical protein